MSQPVKDIGKFVESFVRDVPGKMVGFTQHDKGRREAKEESSRQVSWQQYKPKDIEAFAKTASQMTSMSESELGSARPDLISRHKRAEVPWKKKSIQADYASMAASQKERIEGLYAKSMGRLGEVRRGKQRPGGRKQSLITRKY
jgi:hypothetical protein